MKFSIVGILNTFVGLGVIFLCMKLLKLPYLPSNFIGYAAGLLNSFIWNKLWTFQSKRWNRFELVLFLVIFFISFLVQLAGVVFLVEIIDIKPEYAQVIGIGLYTITNFIGNRFITFRSVGTHEKKT